MSFMTRIRLTAHWIVSDCELGKVSVCTQSRDCVGLHIHVVDAYVCGILRRNSFKGGGGGNVKPRENLIF